LKRLGNAKLPQLSLRECRYRWLRGGATPDSCDWFRDQFRSWLHSANAPALPRQDPTFESSGAPFRTKSRIMFLKLQCNFYGNYSPERTMSAQQPNRPSIVPPKSGSKLLLLRCVNRPLLRCWPGRPHGCQRSCGKLVDRCTSLRSPVEFVRIELFKHVDHALSACRAQRRARLRPRQVSGWRGGIRRLHSDSKCRRCS
jgi:hypothetical protein